MSEVVPFNGLPIAPQSIFEVGSPEYRKDIRKKIVAVELSMKSLDGVMFEIETKHDFGGGIYAREVFIPKNMFLVAKIHNTEHLSIISSGDVSVLSEFGAERYVVVNNRPITFLSKRWTKRIVFAHEDTIWTVLHKTDKTTPDDVELEVIAKDYSELDLLESTPKIVGVIESIGE